MKKQVIKGKVRPARNAVVIAMIERSQNAGPHKDKKKEANRKGCRDWSGDE